MLSAVAARKARLAGRHVPPQAVPSLTKLLSAGDPLKPEFPAKRKPTETTTRPARKKRKKQQKSLGQVPRYVDEDAFKGQRDVVAVDEDSDPSDEGSTDDAFIATSHTSVLEDGDGGSAGAMPVNDRRRRAWSPSAPLRDSSDEEGADTCEDEGMFPGLLTGTPAAGSSRGAPAPLSTFQPVLEENLFYLTPGDALMLHLPPDAAGTLAVLRPSETLALLGTYRLTVLRGAVSLMGSVVAASRSPHSVFAPRSSPIPVLRSVVGTVDSGAVPIPDRVRAVAGSGAAVVLLQELHTGVERLGLLCRTFEGVFVPSRAQSKTPAEDMGLRGVHIVQKETSDTSAFVMPPSWEAALSSGVCPMAGPQVVHRPRNAYLVRGPRNTGKSTFAKVLLNDLLTRYRRVAFLECDLGQSEFTAAGMVALNIVDAPIFGPAFTHPGLPHVSHFVGAASPKSSPSYYLECIQALVQTYNLEVQHGDLLNDNDDGSADSRITDAIPLVVNTMGWTRGLGSDLALIIEEMAEPSRIFELEVPQVDNAYPAHTSFSTRPRNDRPRGADTSDRIRRLDAVAPSAASHFFTAADHRTLSVLSYFHAIFPSPTALMLSPSSTAAVSGIAQTWDVSLPLCAQLPYEIDCAAAIDHIVLVGAGMEDVVPSELAHALNGAVVGLVQCEPGVVGDPPSDPGASARGLPYTQGAAPPSPLLSNCCGLALVRGISHSAAGTLMHVLTPVPPTQLAGVRTLAKGELELPVWGMLDFRGAQDAVAGVAREDVPFLRWGKSEGAGAERRRVRRNLMRRGQM